MLVHTVLFSHTESIVRVSLGEEIDRLRAQRLLIHYYLMHEITCTDNHQVHINMCRK